MEGTREGEKAEVKRNEMGKKQNMTLLQQSCT